MYLEYIYQVSMSQTAANRLMGKDSKVLSLVIVQNDNNLIIAEASVPVIQISSSNAIQKE